MASTVAMRSDSVNPVKRTFLCAVGTKSDCGFKNKLENCGINVTIRREMGRDIGGACDNLEKADKESGVKA